METSVVTLQSRLHHELIQSLIQTGACPNNAELARKLNVSPERIEETLRSLSATHGIVLHPHVCEPWVIHPFSTTPTIHWVRSNQRSWWSPCIWCGLGLCTLVQGNTEIHTRFGAEGDPLVVPVSDGEPVGVDEVWVHFAIPPVHAWDNVHQHCSMVLPFRSQKEIREWCDRHRLPHGEDVHIRQVARLAKLWYGTYADPDWHKWTLTEAQAIFQKSGLISEFWSLGEGRRNF
jgi:hypothetical protein